MNLALILDLEAAAVVIGGTVLASILRCGWRAAWAALRAVMGLFTRRFNKEALRADLALQIQDIAQDGLLRAQPHTSGDAAFDAASTALIRHRSVQALYEEHRQFRLRRQQETEKAVGALNSIGELAPVLGLVGTLLALGSLSVGGMEIADYGKAIGTSVTTTLYGLLLANFVAYPLCSRVQRRADAEEVDRAELLQWLADNLRSALPREPQAAPGERSDGRPSDRPSDQIADRLGLAPGYDDAAPGSVDARGAA